MRSIQIANTVSNGGEYHYSQLRVLKSAAGWYIGTLYTNPDTKSVSPGSRDSDYYSSEERARYALTYLENLERICRNELSPEDIANKWARQMYTLGYDNRQVGYRFFP